MITFKERAEQLAQSCKRVRGNKVYETLAKEYGIGKRQAGDRFKSLFKMPVRDYISLLLIPSDDKIIDCLIQSTSWNEFYNLTGINDQKRLVSILERLFGISNYHKIKLKLQIKQRVSEYKITLADNKAFLISQILGDGSIERNNSFKIEHGYKQYDWLKCKVGLFNTMYPTTNGLEAIKLKVNKSTGYKSFTYRTGGVLSKQLNKLLLVEKSELINDLTPFGVMVYYLDDGYLTYSTKYNTVELGFSSINTSIQQSLQKYFTGYGYKFNITKKGIVLQKKLDVIKFIQEFIEPYKSIIPESMYYKFKYEDIVGNI